MKTFEYLTFNRKVEDGDLNRLGLLGWELVSHTAVVHDDKLRQYYVFKRELNETH